MSDPANYRSKDEVKDFKDNRDPINTVKAAMEAEGVDEADVKAIDKEIKEIVNEAAEFAKTSPEPDAHELWTDVLKEVEG